MDTIPAGSAVPFPVLSEDCVFPPRSILYNGSILKARERALNGYESMERRLIGRQWCMEAPERRVLQGV